MTARPSESALWGDLVYDYRTRLRLSVRAFARRALVTPSYVLKMETRGAVPGRHVVLRVAAALDIQPDMALMAAGYSPVTPAVLQAAADVAMAIHLISTPTTEGEEDAQ